jgi:hypothetical protein
MVANLAIRSRPFWYSASREISPSLGSSMPSSETAVRKKLMGWAETG